MKIDSKTDKWKSDRALERIERETILSKARSDFHLSVLESIFITLRKPNLCRQKEFVYKHKLLA